MTEKEKGMVEVYKDIDKSFKWIGNKLERHEILIQYYAIISEGKRRSVGQNKSSMVQQSV